MTSPTNSPQADAAPASFPADGVGTPNVTGNVTGEESAQTRPRANAASSLRRPGEGTIIEELLRWLSRSMAILALLSSAALLCVGATPLLDSVPAHVASAAFRAWAVVNNAPLSALPLLLAGASYIVLQAVLRPRPIELFKRLMLGAAFLLWGVVELMPAGVLAAELGNLVIALYVVDLSLIVGSELRRSRPHLVP